MRDHALPVDGDVVDEWLRAAFTRFLAPERRPRWLAALEDPRLRSKTVRLNDLTPFDPRRALEIPRKQHKAQDVLALLQAEGAGDRAVLLEIGDCPPRVVSAAQFLPWAFEERVRDFLLVMSGGALAYLQPEDPYRAYLLRPSRQG